MNYKLLFMASLLCLPSVTFSSAAPAAQLSASIKSDNKKLKERSDRQRRAESAFRDFPQISGPDLDWHGPEWQEEITLEIRRGAEPNQLLDGWGMPAILSVVEQNNVPLAKDLMENGAELPPDQPIWEGRVKSVPMAELMWKHKAQKDFKTYSEGAAPLHLAAIDFSAQPELITWFAQKGLSVNEYYGAFDATPLQALAATCENGQESLPRRGELLMAEGADLSLTVGLNSPFAKYRGYTVPQILKAIMALNPANLATIKLFRDTLIEVSSPAKLNACLLDPNILSTQIPVPQLINLIVNYCVAGEYEALEPMPYPNQNLKIRIADEDENDEDGGCVIA